MMSFGLTRRGFHLGAIAGAGLLLSPRLARAQTAFTIAQPVDLQPTNLMPGRQNNNSWVKNVFESLTYMDPKTYEPIPGLATDWTLSDDGLTMELVLADATFHSGRALTPDDVIYSFETAAKQETSHQLGFVAREFSAMKADGKKLVLTFNRRLPNIYEFFERTPIVDRETYDARAEGKVIVGTGPYRFVSWTPGASARIERYEGYRSNGADAIPAVDIAVITDPTAMISALRSGAIQMASGLQPRDAIEFIGNPMFRTIESTGSLYPFGVRVDNAPFDNKLVRQALGFAVDRERINQQVFDSTGTATPLFWQPGSPGYSEELAAQYDYDPDKARAMLKDAGAEGASLTIAAHALPQNRSIFEILQNNLKEVGLNIDGNIMDIQAFGKAQIAGELGPGFIQYHGMVGLSPVTLIDAAPAIRKGNPAKFWSPEYEALREGLKSAVGADAMAAALVELTKYMNDEAWSLNTVQAPGLSVAVAELEGVATGLDGNFRLADASLS